MRLFDLIGAVAVVAWASIVGSYMYESYVKADLQKVDSSVVFEEGESWMLLTREDEEVGWTNRAGCWSTRSSSTFRCSG